MNLSNVSPLVEPRVSTSLNSQPTTAAPAPGREHAGPVDPETSTTQFVPEAEDVSKAVDNLNQQLAKTGQNLTFTLDQDSETVVVKIIERDTQKVIRQIPSEDALALSKSMENMRGLLLNSIA